ncbi:MAG: zinc-dependent peptidase [Lewinella sp.]|nr:zinc-dependent peptidase [Lewinella sp.]
MIPARLLALPLFILFGLLVYLASSDGAVWSTALIPVAVLIALLLVFSPQINWWWWQRYPPDLPGGLSDMLQQRFAYYQRLTPGEQREFRRRTFLFMQAHDFMPQVFKKVPEDVQMMLAAPAVALTFAREEFRFPEYEHVVVYPHPFPSPQFPEHMHIAEYYEPDGVLIFSAEHIGRGFMEPHQYLNPSWYTFGQLCWLAFADGQALPDLHWDDLETISRFSREGTEQWFGLPELDTTALAVTYFFLFPERFQVQLPDHYTLLSRIFEQDPLIFQRP